MKEEVASRTNHSPLGPPGKPTLTLPAGRGGGKQAGLLETASHLFPQPRAPRMASSHRTVPPTCYRGPMT